jgi:hypothetical protein
MSLAVAALLSAVGLFLGMMILFDVGWRIGIARFTRDPEGVAKGGGAVEAAVFALLGLLLAFTFSGAASRFEARRPLITEEANAIGTAYLRLDLLPDDAQPEMRQLFRDYLDTRLETYRNVRDIAASKAKLAESVALQGDIWAKALVACRRKEAPGHAAMLLLPALNAMIDITTTRAVATQNHPPLVIFLLLAGLSLVSALLAGFDNSDSKVRNWLYMVIFAATMSLTLYVILDLEFPRLGMIRIEAADQTLIELRKSMK